MGPTAASPTWTQRAQGDLRPCPHSWGLHQLPRRRMPRRGRRPPLRPRPSDHRRASGHLRHSGLKTHRSHSAALAGQRIGVPRPTSSPSHQAGLIQIFLDGRRLRHGAFRVGETVPSRTAALRACTASATGDRRRRAEHSCRILPGLVAANPRALRPHSPPRRNVAAHRPPHHADSSSSGGNSPRVRPASGGTWWS